MVQMYNFFLKFLHVFGKSCTFAAVSLSLVLVSFAKRGIVPHAVRTIPCTFGSETPNRNSWGTFPFLITKNKRTMRKCVFFMLTAMAVVLSACSNDASDVETEQEMVDVAVRLGGFTLATDEVTRATVGDYATHLEVWITDGTTTTDYHQVSTDTGFGSLSLTLNRSKTYTLYAVAHRAAGAATLSDGVIACPDDKVTHSFYVSQQFTPSTTANLNLTMNRIVSQFQFATTDQVPEWCKTMRFTIYNIFDRWNVSTGGTHSLDRVSIFQNFTAKPDGTVTFNIYAIVTNESTDHDILVEALDANGDVRESHLFEDVPLQINRRTIATGAFFTDVNVSGLMLATDWDSEEEYQF